MSLRRRRLRLRRCRRGSRCRLTLLYMFGLGGMFGNLLGALKGVDLRLCRVLLNYLPAAGAIFKDRDILKIVDADR